MRLDEVRLFNRFIRYSFYSLFAMTACICPDGAAGTCGLGLGLGFTRSKPAYAMLAGSVQCSFSVCSCTSFLYHLWKVKLGLPFRVSQLPGAKAN
jgi:hypothetical protein